MFNMKGGHFWARFANWQGMSVIQAGRSQVSVNTLKKTSVGHFVHRKSTLHLTNASFINLKIVPGFFFSNEMIVFLIKIQDNSHQEISSSDPNSFSRLIGKHFIHRSFFQTSELNSDQINQLHFFFKSTILWLLSWSCDPRCQKVSALNILHILGLVCYLCNTEVCIPCLTIISNFHFCFSLSDPSPIIGNACQ